MAKDKKAKKGREEETGEEVVSKSGSKESTPDNVAAGKPVKKGKKGKKNDFIDNVGEDDNLDLEIDVALQTKKSKSKSLDNEKEIVKDKSKSISENLDGSEDQIKDKHPRKGSKLSSEVEIISKGSQKKKKAAEFDAYDSNDDNDDNDHKSFNKAAAFGLLDIEGDDLDDYNENHIGDAVKMPSSVDDTGESKMGSKSVKKSKKKERRKKNDDDDDDIDKLLEELSLEMKGEKPVEQVTETAAVAKTDALNPEVEMKEKPSKKKKKKNVEVEINDDILEVEPTPEAGDVQEHTVKTAAQKKKEKKEKEKQKKLAQFEHSGKKPPEESKSRKSPDPPIATVDTELPDEEAGETDKKKKKKKKDEDDKTDKTVDTELPDEEAGETDKKKKKDEDDKTDKTVDTELPDEEDGETDKKKKKKKKDEADIKDKKRPGKKQIAAMQEALKKVREEEERLRLEEEEKIRAAEEAELLRLEKLRLNQERKEKKKLKEKEKRERLKAEGKLLSKTQRQSRARMEATLAALREQGVEVPQIGEKKERAPRLGDKKQRLPKKRNENVQEEDKNTEVSPMDTKDSSPEIELEVKIDVPDEEEEMEEDVKDAWDESSDEESELSCKVEIVVKEKSTRSKKASDDSESEESDSTDEDESENESDEDSSSDSEGEGKRNEEKLRERVIERIRKRREEAETNRNVSKLRSPVVCVLGHVDTGKTKILDKIRRTNVQDGEAGGITQQIGATMVPQDALKDQCKMVKNFTEMELKLPGLLIIDTPGHESFSNLRSRGSSLCDIAVLVVDIMHGLEPQTIESINLLKQKKTPFIVALNKIDRLYEWKTLRNRDVQDVIKNQARNTKMEFDDRAKDVILQFAEQGLNAVLHYENTDPRSYISMVPTSAVTGDGMGNLMALVVQLTQSMMVKRLAFSEELQATVLEVKAIPGLGTTIDAILVNGRLREGDTVVFAGYEGAIVTQIRSLLMPQPLKELRVKNFYEEYKEVEGAQGVKIAGKDLDKAIAGLQMLVAHHPDEIPILKEEVTSSFKEAMSSIKVADRGVYVQASTLGSLEALLEFLRASKIPYAGIRIGPVVKRDVMKTSIMLEHDGQFAVILAFDVKIEKDAQELADSLGVKIFQADIIYHLFDKFMAFREEIKNKKREEFKSVAVFPCKLRILPQYVFNSRDPIVVGVIIEAGLLREGTPLCVPSKEFLDIGTVTTIEVNHKAMDVARKGQEVCIKIEPIGGEAPKMFGRHFDHTDMLVSKITRQSIDVCKEYFRDDLQKTDWQLMVELKKIFQIL